MLPPLNPPRLPTPGSDEVAELRDGIHRNTVDVAILSAELRNHEVRLKTLDMALRRDGSGRFWPAVLLAFAMGAIASGFAVYLWIGVG